MIIYRCDRCGKEIETFRIHHVEVSSDLKSSMWDDLLELHLCDDCVDDFREWLNEPKRIKAQTINRLNAFQKAFEEMKEEE